jgi:CRP-like cAMP-binding protein
LRRTVGSPTGGGFEAVRGRRGRDLGSEKILTFQDEYAHKFLVNLKGSASVWQQGQRIRELGPGDFFGEIGLLTSGKRTETIATKSEMEVMVFMEWDLHMIEQEWPTLVVT